MAADTFLDADELATLTGRKRASAQIDALRRMGIPYWINAACRPVVARAAVEGHRATQMGLAANWAPAVVDGD